MVRARSFEHEGCGLKSHFGPSRKVPNVIRLLKVRGGPAIGPAANEASPNGESLIFYGSFPPDEEILRRLPRCASDPQ